MTPTQAQIEAAAIAIFPLMPPGFDYKGRAEQIVKVALTAAAEVEPKIAATLTPGMLALIEKDRAATIERCAQVADTFEEAEFGYNPTAVKIAAAIRAMKDHQGT